MYVCMYVCNYDNTTQGDWGTGVGLLYVYLDDMYSPVYMYVCM